MVHPLTSGSGSGSGIAGAGTGSVGNGTGSGPATVYGQVWLDNNGDGRIDNGEQGYQGFTVNLLVENPDGSYTPGWSTTTNASGGYQFNLTEGPAPGHSYKVQVVLNSVPYVNFQATLPGVSQINARGVSAAFNLANGGWRDIEAGICSMEVTTTQDDPTSPYQDEVTLRDAIETGNNGDGQHQNNYLAVTFVNPQTGQPLGGTITLLAALPAIAASYDVDGPGADTLTVQGNNNAGTIFTVDAGVTSTISGLTITGGNGGNGGGVHNQGDLTLYEDVIVNNQSTGDGGGIYNDSDAQLSLQTVTLGAVGKPNQATKGGGGLYNLGTVTICCGSVIIGNSAGGGGGGIFNSEGTIQVFDDTEINNNIDNGLRGGGVYNWSGKFKMYGGFIAGNRETKSDGGGVYNYFGTMTLTNVAVLSNRAIGYGGGIYTYEGSLTLTNKVSIGSSALADRNFAQRGGGMYVNDSVVKMTGGAITNNTATAPSGGAPPAFSGGGGLFVNAGSVTITNVSISNNGSTGAGGGVYVRSGGLKLINDVISKNVNNNNAVGVCGAGMCINGGTVTVSGGTVQNNIAINGNGGGIYNNTGSLTLNSYVIAGNTFPVLVKNNYASNNGGGMYLANNSKTTFNDATVSGNTTFLNTQTTGRGVFEQQFATVNIAGVLIDNDDDGGVPYRTGIA